MTEYKIIITQTNEFTSDFDSPDEAAKCAYEAIWDETTGDYSYHVEVKKLIQSHEPLSGNKYNYITEDGKFFTYNIQEVV